MRIAVGADHAGTPLNEVAIAELHRVGHEIVDLGTHDPSQPDDYPDYAAALGVAVAANKVPGIRAGMCHDTYSAHQGVEHDNMNVLCVGARVVGPELMLDLVRAFVAARFTGEKRHRRRLAKVGALEQRFFQETAMAQNRKVA